MQIPGLKEPELTQQAKNRYQIAKAHAKEWRDRARLCFDFVSSHQISDKDMKILEKKKRPAVVFNLIGPNVKAVSGMERGNRHQITYLPREESEQDGIAASIYNQVYRWIRDRSGDEQRESTAFKNCAICGMGWTQTRVDYDDDPEGMVHSPVIDPLRKLWDPSAKDENLIDRRYDFTEVLMDKDEFEDLFPDYEDDPQRRVFSSSIMEDFEEVPEIERRPDNYEGSDQGSDPRQFQTKYAVLEYNFIKKVKVWKITAVDGDEFDSTDQKRVKELAKAVMPDGSPAFQIDPQGKQKRYYKAWFTGDNLVEVQESADPHSFVEQCITGEYDRNNGYWRGVVDDMIDPQKWSNMLFMQLLHIVNANTKGGFFYRKGAFVNKNKALEDYAKGDTAIEIDTKGEGIEATIMERTAASLPQALHELLLFVIGIIPRVTGFNMELLGMAGRDQPGILENMRKQAGMTILAPLFDSLRSYRQIKARTMIHFMKEYVGIERMVRIVNDQTKPMVAQIMALPDVSKFDIHADEAPYSPNLKTSNFAMLNDFLQASPQLKTVLADIVLEMSPLPQDMIDKISERMAQQQQPPPEQVRQIQLQLQKLQAEIEELRSKALLNEAKAQEASTAPARDMQRLQKEGMADRMKFAGEMIKTQVEMVKDEHEGSGKSA